MSPLHRMNQIDYSKKWAVMTVVSVGTFLSVLDGNIVNIALPTIVDEMGADFATVQWVVLIYLLTMATLMLGIGRLGDMFGKKRLYMAGFVLFTVGSLLCGLSPTIYWLIGSRVVQAGGAAMIMALGTAIATEAFPPAERGKAMGINGAVISVGIIVGPTVGGFIIGQFVWNWIFFVNLPVGIVGTLMAMRYLPVYAANGRQKFDFVGALALFVALFGLLMGLTLGQRWGFGSTAVLALFALHLFTLTFFIWWEWRIKQPMVDLRIFRNVLFSVNLFTGLLTFVSIAGAIILLPFYLQNVLEFTPQKIGLLLAVVPVVLAIISPLSGIMSDRMGTRLITAVGLAILVFGYYAMSTLNAETSGLGFVLRLLPIGIGMGVFSSPNNSAVMGAVTRARLGIASGLLALTRTLGQTTGIALLGAFWAARVVYYNNAPIPEGATTASAAVQAASLQDTFLLMMGIMAVAFLVGIWAFLYERQHAGEQPANAA